MGRIELPLDRRQSYQLNDTPTQLHKITKYKELYPRRELDAGEPHATHRCLRSAMSLSSMINIHWGATSFAPKPCPFCIQLFYKELEFTTNPLLSKPQNKGKGK